MKKIFENERLLVIIILIVGVIVGISVFFLVKGGGDGDNSDDNKGKKSDQGSNGSKPDYSKYKITSSDGQVIGLIEPRESLVLSQLDNVG